MTDEMKRCGNCGEVVPGDAPEGICPQCVLLRATAGGGRGDGQPAAGIGVEEVRGLFPNLEIEGELGRGGMGVVFKGRQVSLGRDVAVKLLKSGVGGDAERDERFLREARALAKLEHPGVTAVYDFGRAGDFWFLITEFVGGESLEARLGRGAIEEAEALVIWKQVAAAIAYAHGKGVVHRDVKPGNVLLGDNGDVKVADFGLAKVFGENHCDFTLTLDSQALGTPYYMAPEQRGGGEIDHRADLYALGVLLFEMLTGKVPEVSAEAPPELGRFEPIVMRAMRAEPGERYGTVEAMVNEIGEGAAETKKPWGPVAVFKKRWWAFLVGFLGGPIVGWVAAALIVYSLAREFESRVIMEVASQRADISRSIFEQTQFQVLQSRKVLGEVVDDCGLERRWLMDRDAAIEELKGSLEVSGLKGTDLIDVRVFRPDADEAAELANGIGSTYLDLIAKSRAGDGDSGSPAVKLHERAEPSAKPARPQVGLMLLTGTVAGMVLAIPVGILLMYLVHWMIRWR